MTFDIIIQNGNLVIGNEIVRGSVGIKDGKISALILDSTSCSAQCFIDARDKIVLPGLIDANIHMRVPGMAHKEDFTTGSSAASAGGVTCILDMPNTNPPTTTLERLQEKKELSAGRFAVDYAFHFGGAVDNLDQLEKLEHVPAVKFFMAGHETTPTTVSDIGILLNAFRILSEKDIPAAVHAEHQMLIRASADRFKHRTDFKAYSELRNDTVCEAAVNELISISGETGCRVYICHVSSKKEITAIRRAKADGIRIMCEAVPYHLFLSNLDCERLGAFSKVSPALKSPEDQEALWEAVLDGTVDCIASEHTPHTIGEKQKSVWDAPAGCPGVQEMLPLLLTKGLSPVLIARLCAENPAKIFGMKAKGKIQIGYDADLVIVDMKKKWTVNRKDLLSKCGWSNYEGMKLKGIPVMTLVRGRIVYENGKIASELTGKWCKAHC